MYINVIIGIEKKIGILYLYYICILYYVINYTIIESIHICIIRKKSILTEGRATDEGLLPETIG